jgi:RHS repeat-associated protein
MHWRNRRRVRRRTSGRSFYNYFRDYDPYTGRYVQSDPIGLEGGINTYGYVGGNPMMRFDSNGLTSINVNIAEGYMVVDPEVPGRAPYTHGITSGRDACMNNPKCSDEKDKGPIPPGFYKINVAELSNPGVLGGIARTLRSGDWGDWRVPIHPRPRVNTYGRSGFFLHGGRWLGSAGCIDVGGGQNGNYWTDKLLRDLLADPDGIIPVIVQ